MEWQSVTRGLKGRIKTWGHGLLLLFVFLLHGCMMPFMMGPMLSETVAGSDKSRMDEAVQDLIREGIAVLKAEIEPNKEIALGETTVTGNLFSRRKFRGMFLEELRSRNAYRVLDLESPSVGGHQEATPPVSQDQELTPVVRARLYAEDDRLVLAIELRNGRTNQRIWMDRFTTVLPGTSEDSGRPQR